MHKFFATTALTLLLVTPAMAQSASHVSNCGSRVAQPAGDGEIQNDVQWQCLVDQANAHRAALMARNGRPAAKPATDTAGASPVVERDASVSSTIQSDTTTSRMTERRPHMSLDAAVNTPHRPYTRIEDYWQDK